MISEFLDLVCYFDPEEKYVNAAANGRFILCLTEYAASHANLQCNPGEKGVLKVKAIELVPKEYGNARPEKNNNINLQKKKVALKHKRKGSMMQIGYARDPQMSFSDT